MLGLAFVYVLMFSFAFQSMGEGQIVAIITAVGYMFVMMGSAWEEKNNSDVLWNSLPTSKAKIVGAKYLSVFAYVAIVVPIYWLMSTVLSLLNFQVVAVHLNLVGIALGMVVVFLTSSLYFPVYFAVGYTKSRYWHFILFFGIFSLASVLPRLVPEKPAWVDSLLEKLPTITNDLTFFVLLGVGIAIMVGISFLLSLRFYGRREF